MNKLLTFLFVAIAFISGFPQGGPSEPGKKPDKVFFGLGYNYLHADMTLLSMTKKSVWDNQDLGTVDIGQDDIDSINSYMDYTEQVHNINLAVGMVLLNKPGGHWFIDGRISAGFNYRTNNLLNTDNDTAEVKIKSVHYSPEIGLGFNFMYSFNDKWAINLGVNSHYGSGKVNKIDENIYPVVAFLAEDRENKYRISYSTINFLASYTYKKFTFQAGPGFYWLFNKNEYHIVRSDENDGSTYEDSIETTLRSEMFIDGYLQVGWRISGHFMIIASTGISKDISANAALVYFL
jgi:long-subunit fatty acid transport protein